MYNAPIKKNYSDDIILISDIDECSQTTDEELCGVNRQCMNTVGSYECVCATGYVLVNGTCEGECCDTDLL